MAVATGTVFEVRTTGGAVSANVAVGTLCSSGFVTGASGTDYSQQAAQQYGGTDLVTIAGTTLASPVSHTWIATDTGNIILIGIASGATPGGYQCISVAATVATIDRSPTAASGNTYCVGGAAGSPGGAGWLMSGANGGVGGMICTIKSGTYTTTSGTPNIDSGNISGQSGTAVAATTFVGYGSSRADNGTKPVFLMGGALSASTLVTQNANNHIENMTLDGAANTTSKGIAMVGSAQAFRCQFQNFTGSAATGGGLLLLCYATTCSTAIVFSGVICDSCTGVANTFTVFACTGAQDCYAINNTGASTDGYTSNASSCMHSNCVAYGNGRDGWRVSAATATKCTIKNCYAESNTGSGFNATSTSGHVWLYRCYTFGNGTGINANIPATQQVSCGTLSGTAFVSAGGLNFALNSTAGAGAVLKANMMPDAGTTYNFPGISTLAYGDIGPAQSQAGAGGSISIITNSPLTIGGWGMSAT